MQIHCWASHAHPPLCPTVNHFILPARPSRTASSKSSAHQGQIPAHTQQQWYETEHAEHLRAVLQLPPYRFQNFIASEPDVLGFQPDTLSMSLQALSEALHVSQKSVVQVCGNIIAAGTHVVVVDAVDAADATSKQMTAHVPASTHAGQVLEHRPAILLQPTQPVQVLHQVAALVDRTLQQTAFLLTPHPHLLALPPAQLQQRVNSLCEVLLMQQHDLKAAIAEAGAPAFLHLLASPVQQTHQQLSDLCVALDANGSTAAALVQYRPHILGMSPAVIRSRVFALAEAAGQSCRQFLEQLDKHQVKGLSSLLLLSPGRLLQQLAGLEALLEGRKTRAVAVHLLLRLGTRVSLPEAQVMMVALQGVCRHSPAWQQQLLAASDQELAVLLSGSHQGLAQAMFLSSSGQGGCESLIKVMTCPPQQFEAQHGAAYRQWLAGKGLQHQ